MAPEGFMFCMTNMLRGKASRAAREGRALRRLWAGPGAGGTATCGGGGGPPIPVPEVEAPELVGAA